MTQKRTVIYIPLDERPCNYLFPVDLAAGTDVDLRVPPFEWVGIKKQPADIPKLWQWLNEQAQDADGAILSLDTLLYGGILPSRLHQLSLEDCREQLEQLKKIKAAHPKLIIHAFSLIMRCPRYSSSDEEPDYYEDWGTEIFRQGYIGHRMDMGIASEEEIEEKQKIDAVLPEDVRTDYLSRRAVNIEVNKLVIDLVKEGVIDFMIVPQDDSAPFGLTAIDQQKVREHVRATGTELRVYMYPGADEVGCTLLARMINIFHERRPLVYPRFSSAQGPYITPLYEDRLLYESLKYQIIAAGGLLASSLQEADMVLLVNTPGETMMESVSQRHPNVGYNVFRNIVELTEMADYIVNILNKPCVVADIAFANGSDLTLVRLIQEKQLLFKLAGYAGWNTSSNTLGTCIAQGMLFSIYGETQEHLDFLSLRYTEDAGYCSMVRQNVCDHELPQIGMNYFAVDGQRGKASELVRQQLTGFIDSHINTAHERVVIEDCYMPWGRMFEVGLRTRFERR